MTVTHLMVRVRLLPPDHIHEMARILLSCSNEEYRETRMCMYVLNF